MVSFPQGYFPFVDEIMVSNPQADVKDVSTPF